MRYLCLALLFGVGCSSSTMMNPGGGGGSGGGGGGSGGGGGGGSGDKSAAALATTLRGSPHFLIGMGNDLANDHAMDGAYTLGPTLDLHYTYMVGIGSGAWPTWNANGSFVNIMTDSADAKGVVPMFTLYQMAAWGDGNLAGLGDDTFMQSYWDQTRLLFQRIAMYGKPAVVHVEPDFWGYAEMTSKGVPSMLTVKVSASECSGLPNDVSGMARCIFTLARMYAPKAVVGLHASEWGGAPGDIVAFMKAVGADQGDFLSTDLLDRDAGCFEAHTDPNCMRGGTTGWYWDETNQTSPNFHDFLAYSKTLHDGVGLPLLWWQVPFGVPSSTPGGTAGHYRDNRVHYIFGHIDEFVAAGGVGVAFGTGAGNQTYITSDGGQFKDAVTAYFAHPTAL
jgi:hypothetical protein